MVINLLFDCYKMQENGSKRQRPWTLPTRVQQKIHMPKIDTYFKEITECQRQYSKLRLTPEIPVHTSSPLPFIFPRSHTTSKIELRPTYARTSPALLCRQHTKLSWQLKTPENKQNDSLETDEAPSSSESQEDNNRVMDPVKLCEHLRDSGFGEPVMITWSAKDHLSKFNLPRGLKSRKLPKNPSQREKIKGRARLDYEMANLRAVAFCERHAPKIFRTASAHMRNRDVQFIEAEMKEHMQREENIDGDDDNDSIIVMKVDREELVQRINTWIEDVRKSMES